MPYGFGFDQILSGEDPTMPVVPRVPMQAVVNPVAPPSPAATGWQGIFQKINSDPLMQAASLQFAAKLAQGRRPGQSSLGAFGEAMGMSQDYLMRARMQAQEQALAKKKAEQEDARIAAMMQLNASNLKLSEEQLKKAQAENAPDAQSARRAQQEAERDALKARTEQDRAQTREILSKQEAERELKASMSEEEWKSYKLDPKGMGEAIREIRLQYELMPEHERTGDKNIDLKTATKKYAEDRRRKTRMSEMAVQVQALNAALNFATDNTEREQITKQLASIAKEMSGGGAAAAPAAEAGKTGWDSTTKQVYLRGQVIGSANTADEARALISTKGK